MSPTDMSVNVAGLKGVMGRHTGRSTELLHIQNTYKVMYDLTLHALFFRHVEHYIISHTEF